MKVYSGKVIFGCEVEVEDNATIEEIKAKLADRMGWDYFCTVYPDGVFDVKEVKKEENK